MSEKEGVLCPVSPPSQLVPMRGQGQEEHDALPAHPKKARALQSLQAQQAAILLILL